MKRSLALVAGIAILAGTWAGPLPSQATGSFTAHMTMHMCVVALAAPLLGYGLAERVAGGPWRRILPLSPLLVSLADLVIIWAWHTPLAHEAARTSVLGLVAEQASFFLVGMLLWLSVFQHCSGHQHRLIGAGALLFTSMHMTLLGVLISLAPKPICTVLPGNTPLFGLAVMEDQQIGGLLMLGIGGAIYLLSGLALIAGLLEEKSRTSGEQA